MEDVEARLRDARLVPAPRPVEGLLEVDDLAAWLRLRKDAIYRLAADGELPAIKLSTGRLRFRREDVERWLDERARRNNE